MIQLERRFPVVITFISLALLAPAVSGAAAQDPAATDRRLEAMQAENNLLKARLAETEVKLAQVMQATAKLQDESAQIRKQHAQMQQLTAQLQAERDKNLQSVVQLTNQLHQAFGELNRLKLENARLGALVPEAFRKGVAIQGLVTNVGKEGLVEISIGADDGLRQGHRLVAYRVAGDTVTQLGQIEVVQTRPDGATCRIDPELAKGPLQKDDRVATSVAPKGAAPPSPPSVDASGTEPPPNLVDGSVLSVGQEGELEISFGADDGLRARQQLDVYRAVDGQGIYIGRIEVVQTSAKKSVCRIVPEFRKDAMRPGDRVVSKID
ncbi:MAG: hypothetical protein JXB62_18140 [Pirellulales bacterium]|nr:hypothetical protein [Pirellulales bacterium]